MPNNITNILKIKGQRRDEIKAFMSGKDKHGRMNLCDFDRIVPMPDSVGDDWYDWSCTNWGTKWNSYRHQELKNGSILFETAWASPFPIFKALSLRFPDVQFELRFADEDIGHNCGHMVIENGKFTNLKPDLHAGSDKAKSFARRVKSR